VLDGSKEVERQLLNLDYFMLSKDWEFDEGQIETLYCLAMPKQRETALMTVRDLTAEHLPLLKNIRDKSLAEIQKRFNLAPSQIRAFFHYLPTYFHMHIHFVHVKMLNGASA